MTATVANSTTTEASVILANLLTTLGLPSSVTIGVAAAKVTAPAALNADKDGIKYTARVRVPLLDDKRTDDEVLASAGSKDGFITFGGAPVNLASKYRGENGQVVVGRSMPREDRTGKVIRPGQPMLNFWSQVTIGDVGYQVLVKCVVGSNSKGRFVDVRISGTKQPTNEFTQIGEVEGDIAF